MSPLLSHHTPYTTHHTTHQVYFWREMLIYFASLKQSRQHKLLTHHPLVSKCWPVIFLSTKCMGGLTEAKALNINNSRQQRNSMVKCILQNMWQHINGIHCTMLTTRCSGDSLYNAGVADICASFHSSTTHNCCHILLSYSVSIGRSWRRSDVLSVIICHVVAVNFLIVHRRSFIA